MPKVSIIMPVYNASAYLVEAIESLLRQTFDDFIIIAIDDCSTDDSCAKLKALASCHAAHDRIRVFRNRDNRGVTETLNIGLSMVESAYTARMDADDISEPNRLAAQLAVFENAPDIGLVASTVRQFWSDGKETIFPNSLIADDLVPLAMTFENPIVHPTVMARTSTFSESNLRYSVHMKHVEDYDLFCRMSQITRIRIIPEPLLRYRMHPEQVSAKFAAEQTRAMRAVSIKQAQALGLRPTQLEQRLNTCLGNAVFPVPGFQYLLARWTQKLAREYSNLTGVARSDVLSFIQERQELALRRHCSTLRNLRLPSKLYWRGKSILQAINGSQQ